MSNRETTDRSDPGLHKERASGQNVAYLVLSVEERAKGFVRPVRTKYLHEECGAVTQMSQGIAETYARDPNFYGATFCSKCRDHFPVDEFVWDDGSNSKVGS